MSLKAPINPAFLFCLLFFLRTLSFGQNVPAVSADTAFVDEGDGTNAIVFTFLLSGPSSNEVSIRYTTYRSLYSSPDHQAIPNSEYIPTSGILVFPPGTTSQVVEVTIFGDYFYEPWRIFSLALTDPTNAILTVTNVTGAIMDDDQGPPTPTCLEGFRCTRIVDNLVYPTRMEFAPDGRLFICQQDGKIRILKNGSILPEPFLDLNLPPGGEDEAGLLGITFDPDFQSNGYIYVYYTYLLSESYYGPILHNRVSRFTAAGDKALPESEVIIFEMDELQSARIHNGGDLHFGVDGKLYISVGDNGNGTNSQTLTNLLGKILRINPDGSIPADNPFYNVATDRNRAIWAFGLRNPFTFAVQPTSGRIYINDDGEYSWEEINEGVPGENYGWPYAEGASTNSPYRGPIHTYRHSSRPSGSITGGVFYNPVTNSFRALDWGAYFFADYVGGWLHKFDPTNGITKFGISFPYPVDLKVGPNGNLYCLNQIGGAMDDLGSIFEIQYGLPYNLTFLSSGGDFTQGSRITLQVQAEGKNPFTYQWMLNGTNIARATNATLVISNLQPANVGNYSVLISNFVGSATSSNLPIAISGRTVIASGLRSQTAYAGSDVLLSVSAFGGEPLSYQWRFNGKIIPDATNASLQLNQITSDSAGQYSVFVSNRFGAVLSQMADLKLQYCHSFPQKAIFVNAVAQEANVLTLKILCQNPGWFFVNTNDWIDVNWVEDDDDIDDIFLYTVPNYNPTPRQGYVSIAGRPLLIVQGCQSISKSDFNGDKQNDLLFQNADGVVASWFMSGTNLLGTALLKNGKTVGAGWKVVGQSDFNQDAQDDILFQHTDGKLAVWFMSQTNVVGVHLLQNGISAGEWRAVGINDFNHSGTPRILFQHSDGRLAYWCLNGTNFVTAIFLRNGISAGPWRAVGSGDFNRDAYGDILFQHTDGRLAVWYFIGSDLANAQLLAGGKSAGAGWKVVALSDFDNDGSLDILFQHDDGKLAVWYMDGSNLLRASLLLNSSGAWRVVGPK